MANNVAHVEHARLISLKSSKISTDNLNCIANTSLFRFDAHAAEFD